MTNKEYADYVKNAAKNGEVVYPRDVGTNPNVFGIRYAGSSLKRKNDIRTKNLSK